MPPAARLRDDGLVRRLTGGSTMDFHTLASAQEGRAGYILLWLLGVPIPILFLIYLLRGCT
jgi:hypothetical protein